MTDDVQRRADELQAEVSAGLEPGPEREPTLDEIVAAFRAAEDVREVYATFRELVPPRLRLDRDLLHQELEEVLAEKGVKRPGQVIRDWFATHHVDTREDSGTDVASLIVEPEEWPDPVDGVALVDDLVTYFGTFVDAPAHVLLTASLWSIVTHVYDLFDVLAMLVLGSPVRACGKSTFLTLIRRVSARAIVSSSITGPALFRTVERYRPTLLVDEGHVFTKLNLELQAIVNSSHAKASAFVVRAVGESFEPRVFRTWCPKALTAIGGMPDQIESRSIRLPLERMPSTVRKERARDRSIERAVGKLHARSAAWARQHQVAIRSEDADSVMAGVPELLGRDADNWEPLLVVAHLCGGDVLARTIDAARALAGVEAPATVELLLGHIREAFLEADLPDGLWTEEILRALFRRDDGPWGDWWGPEVTPERIAVQGGKLRYQLRDFRLRSRDVRRGDDVRKGYYLSDLEPIWTRYLGSPTEGDVGVPSGAATAATPQVARLDAGRYGEQDPEGPVAARNGQEPLPSMDVAAVAASTGGASSKGACSSCGATFGHLTDCERSDQRGQHRGARDVGTPDNAR